MRDRSWLRSRLRSFSFALGGIRYLVGTQVHAKLHALATVLAIALGAYCGITRPEWLSVLIVIGGVWSAEAFNTAVEVLCDRLHPERDASIGIAKDLAAAGVLLMAIAAAAVGAVVFLPYLSGKP